MRRVFTFLSKTLHGSRLEKGPRARLGGGVVEEVFMCGDVNSLSVIGVCLFLFPFFFRRLFFP